MIGHAAFPDLCAELLREGRTVRFRAKGWSMEPAIRDGDLLTVAPARADEVAVGDVVLYLAERGPTAHRVVARGGAALRVRGDAAGGQEERVGAERVYGRVQSVGSGRKSFVARCFARLGRPLTTNS